jgi:hypothetical protein
VFVALIIAALYDFSGMGFVLLDGRVREEPHVVMHVKVEERA